MGWKTNKDIGRNFPAGSKGTLRRKMGVSGYPPPSPLLPLANGDRLSPNRVAA
ncbi:MAG: hypothetical protein RL518_1366 [Pseudomonadota bacterium]